eukprot:g38197.t1
MKCRFHNDCKTYTLIGLCCITVAMCIGFAYWWYKNDHVDPSPAGLTLTPGECTSGGGRAFGGHCYTADPLKEAGWEDAEQACRDRAGNLVSILTEEENKFVGSLPTSTKGMWIGLQKTSGLKEQFLWSDGSAELTGANFDQPYASWASGMPRAGPDQLNIGCTYLQKPDAADGLPQWTITKVCEQARVYCCKHPLASTPSRPNNVTAVSAQGGLSVDWTPPLTDGGRALTKYIVRAVPDKTEWPLLAPSEVELMDNNTIQCKNATSGCRYTVAGLVPKVRYLVSVAAANEVGTSPFQEAPSQLPAGDRAPDRPVGVQVQNANAACVLRLPQYPPTFDGGQPITAFKLTIAGSTTTYSGTDLAKKQHIVNSLTNGQSYPVTILAENSIGSSGTVSVNCQPSSLYPVAPTLNEIEMGFRSSFLNYSQTGAFEIIAYAEPLCADADDCPATMTSTETNQSTGILTISNLTTNQTYAVWVEALDEQGNVIYESAPAFLGGNELLSKATPQPQAPSIVRSVSASVSGLDISVRFQYPESDGDSPLLYFLLTVESPEKVNFTANVTQAVVSDATESAVLLDGELLKLATSTNYTVVVTAHNAEGSSPPTAPLLVRTGTSAPRPPRNVTAVAGERLATITWFAPEDFGDGPSSTSVHIASYLVVPSPAGFLLPNRTLTPAQANCPCTGKTPAQCNEMCSVVYDLGKGSEHLQFEFYILATNDAMSTNDTTSAASVPSDIVTVLATTSSAPVSPVATPLQRALNLTFSYPNDDGGDKISKYEAVGATNNVLGSSVLDLKYILLEGLDARQSYTLSVRAVNARGNGAMTSAVTATPQAGKPSMPLDVSLQPGDGEVRITYNKPLEDGGADIANYTAFSTPAGFSVTTSDNSTFAITVTGLKNGHQYNFQVFATNVVGQAGEPSTLSAPIEAGRTFTTLEYVAGVSAFVITIMILCTCAYTVWWAWVEKELCWDDGDPNTRANAKKRKEAEAKLAAEQKAQEEGGVLKQEEGNPVASEGEHGIEIPASTSPDASASAPASEKMTAKRGSSNKGGYEQVAEEQHTTGRCGLTGGHLRARALQGIVLERNGADWQWNIMAGQRNGADWQWIIVLGQRNDSLQIVRWFTLTARQSQFAS